MASNAERLATQHLRALLADLPVGASIGDSVDFRAFQSALEHVIPQTLVGTYPWWRYESLDAVDFTVARKIGPETAEFIGICQLISDQSWTPLYLRIRASPDSDGLEWIDCKLGEAGNGNGGMVRTLHGRETKLRYSVAERLDAISWAYAVTRGSASAEA